MSLLALACHLWLPQCEEDGQVFFSLDDGATKFTDLIQLVEFYQLNRGVLPCKLKHPCTVVALWHLGILRSRWPHIAWPDCLKQTKQQEPFCWLVLFVFSSTKSWWIDWRFVVVILCWHVESAGDCWHVGFLLVCMDASGVGCTTCSWARRERIKEKINTAVWIYAVAKSATIMLPIVINKLGHSGCCGFIMQLKHRLFFPLTGQSSGQLCSLRTNSSVTQMSSHVLDEYTIDGELTVSWFCTHRTGNGFWQSMTLLLLHFLFVRWCHCPLVS